MPVGGARNSRSHTSVARLVCEDALNAGVSARAAAFMPAPDHSPAPASRRCDGAQSGRYALDPTQTMRKALRMTPAARSSRIDASSATDFETRRRGRGHPIPECCAAEKMRKLLDAQQRTHRDWRCFVKIIARVGERMTLELQPAAAAVGGLAV